MKNILLCGAGLVALLVAACADSGDGAFGSRPGLSAERPSPQILSALALSEGQPQGPPLAAAPSARNETARPGRRTTRRTARAARRRVPRPAIAADGVR